MDYMRLYRRIMIVVVDDLSRAFFDFLKAARHLDAAPPIEKRVSDTERAEMHRLLNAEINAEEKARSASGDGNVRRA